MRRMGIGLGVGINRSNYAQGIFNAYQSRVIADGGVTEAGSCVNAVSSLLQSASLLIIPSGYKGGKAYAEIPTNGNGDLTWTRASDAWRTNADGLIQRVPWNLVQYSEEFSNAYWNKINSTLTANVITAPNGTLTADLLVENSANGAHLLGRSSLSFPSTSYTLSIYAKAKERSKILVFIAGSNAKGYGFDLANGTMSAVTGVTAADSYSMTNVGDGWYRCSITITSGTITATEFYPLQNFSNYTYQGDGTSGLYFWGAQLVEGSSAQTYFPTTDRLNVPRLSYMYGSCPALLLEPQRTNVALYSEQFDNAGWVKVGSSVTANSTTSPSGVQDADTFSGDGILGGHELRQTISFTNGTTYTFSVYAKKNTNNFLQLIGGSLAFGLNVWANFDLNNGVVGTVGSSTTASIQNVGNGWYRCVITAAASVTSSAFVVPFLIPSATSIRGESSTLSTSVYLWGIQVEAGAYPTTYIPTTTASATRVADTFSKSSISSLINSVEGVLYCQFRVLANDNVTKAIILNDGTINNRLSISVFANAVFMSLTVGGVSQVFSSSTITPTNFNKFAFKYKANDFGLWVNGTKVLTSTSGSTFSSNTLNQFASIQADGTSAFNGFIQQLAIFNTALSDAELVSLTT